MDFNSLGANAPVYIVRKKPYKYVVGTFKSKAIPQPNIYNLTPPQKIDIVVSVDGSDENIPGVPANVEIVDYGNSFYATTPEGASQAIYNLVQASKARLSERAYDESVIADGEKTLEELNPQFRQERVVRELQKRQDIQDKQIAEMKAQNSEMLAILRQLNGGAGS